MVLLSGSALSIPWADEHIPAIVQGWYPGAQGGRAIAQVLFDDYSPEGKLPVTFYRTTEELPEFTDYNMANRTYRYMKNEALILLDMDCHIQSLNCPMYLNADKIVPGNNVLCTADIKWGICRGLKHYKYVKVKQEGAPNCAKGTKEGLLKSGQLKPYQ